MTDGQPTIFTNCRQCFGGGDRGSQLPRREMMSACLCGNQRGITP
jgi:hypothetical protein